MLPHTNQHATKLIKGGGGQGLQVIVDLVVLLVWVIPQCEYFHGAVVLVTSIFSTAPPSGSCRATGPEYLVNDAQSLDGLLQSIQEPATTLPGVVAHNHACGKHVDPGNGSHPVATM